MSVHADSILLSVKAGEALDTTTAAYRMAYISAEDTIKQIDTTTNMNQSMVLMQNDGRPSGGYMSVIKFGLGKVHCNDTFTAGGEFESNTTGSAIPHASDTVTAEQVRAGIILETVSATNTIADCFFNPRLGAHTV